jgi:hypothetical protein
LFPRYKGFAEMLRAVEPAADAQVLDLTVAFSGNGFSTALPLSTKGRRLPHPFHLITGTGPTHIHVYASRHYCKDIVLTPAPSISADKKTAPSSLPTALTASDQQVEEEESKHTRACKQWLIQRWAEKDALLKQFEGNGQRFPHLVAPEQQTRGRNNDFFRNLFCASFAVVPFLFWICKSVAGALIATFFPVLGGIDWTIPTVLVAVLVCYTIDAQMVQLTKTPPHDPLDNKKEQ